MSGQVKRLVGVLVVAGSVALTGCGGGSTGSTSSAPGVTSAASAPEEQRATPAAVAAGLQKIQGIAAQIAAAGTDTAKAKALDGQIEPQWKQIEGTVKANDQSSYQAFEDAFTQLEGAADKGDAAAAATGSQTVASTVQSYLTRYPG